MQPALIAASAKVTAVERAQGDREKHGVFTGRYVVNPINGEKVPVCNKEEFAKDYYTNRREQFSGAPAYNWKNYVGTSSVGVPFKCYIWNGKCYIFVIYDSFELYAWSLYSCDLSGGNFKEVYNWEAKSPDERCGRDICFCEGSMFFECFRKENENETTSTIKRLDLENGKDKTLYEYKEIGISTWLHANDSGNIELQEYHNVSNEPTVVYKYDSEKDEFVKEGSVDAPEGKLMSSARFGGVYSWLVKPEGKRKCDLINDYYRISTAVTTGRIVYADEKLAILYNNVKLHIYNLEKMEHCVLDVDDLGSDMAMYDGKLFIGNRGNNFRMPVYCVIPELGITYPIVEDGIYSDICATADGVTFNETSRQVVEIKSAEIPVDENGEELSDYVVNDENGVSYIYTGGYSREYDKIEKVWTVKKK